MKAPNEKILKYNKGMKFDEAKAIEIMEHNLVCSNFFDWDFENWCTIKQKK